MNTEIIIEFITELLVKAYDLGAEFFKTTIDYIKENPEDIVDILLKIIEVVIKHA